MDKHILLVTIFETLQSQACVYVVSKQRNIVLDNKHILLVTYFETLQSQARVYTVSKPRSTLLDKHRLIICLSLFSKLYKAKHVLCSAQTEDHCA